MNAKVGDDSQTYERVMGKHDFTTLYLMMTTMVKEKIMMKMIVNMMVMTIKQN